MTYIIYMDKQISNVINKAKGQTPEQCKVITIHDDCDHAGFRSAGLPSVENFGTAK